MLELLKRARPIIAHSTTTSPKHDLVSSLLRPVSFHSHQNHHYQRLYNMGGGPSYSQTMDKKPINLHRGWPSTTLLPVDALKTAAQSALSDPSILTPSSALLYAPDPGLQVLREALSSWLAQFYSPATPSSPDQITITGGASQSLANILASFTDPGFTKAVWMVAPAYFLACPIMADAGFGGKMRAVPEDEEGIDLEFLRSELEKVDSSAKQKEDKTPLFKNPEPFRKIYQHVIYCVPTFSNPSGKTMSLRRRKGLVELAREYDALIVADDVYDMLQWPVSAIRSGTGSSGSQKKDLSGTLLPRLVDIDLSLGPSTHDLQLSSPNASDSKNKKHFGHAISNGSFSKLAGPGLRTGWTQSSPDFALGLSQTGATRSGGAPSQMTASIVCKLLTSGDLQSEIEGTLRPAYQRRHGKILEAVERELRVPFGVEVRRGSLHTTERDERAVQGQDNVFGGYFIWLTLPQGKDFPGAGAIADRCKEEENLIIGYGGMFEVQGDEKAVSLDHAIRLCFAWEGEDNLVQGVERIGQVIGRMLKEGPANWERAQERSAVGTVHEQK